MPSCARRAIGAAPDDDPAPDVRLRRGTRTGRAALPDRRPAAHPASRRRARARAVQLRRQPRRGRPAEHRVGGMPGRTFIVGDEHSYRLADVVGKLAVAPGRDRPRTVGIPSGSVASGAWSNGRADGSVAPWSSIRSGGDAHELGLLLDRCVSRCHRLCPTMVHRRSRRLDRGLVPAAGRHMTDGPLIAVAVAFGAALVITRSWS